MLANFPLKSVFGFILIVFLFGTALGFTLSEIYTRWRLTGELDFSSRM